MIVCTFVRMCVHECVLCNPVAAFLWLPLGVTRFRISGCMSFALVHHAVAMLVAMLVATDHHCVCSCRSERALQNPIGRKALQNEADEQHPLMWLSALEAQLGSGLPNHDPYPEQSELDR